jgi:hypothetical protein
MDSPFSFFHSTAPLRSLRGNWDLFSKVKPMSWR